MPDIDKNLFAGREQITAAEWATLVSTSMGQQAVAELLESSGWDRKAAGCVGLKLSPDNSSILSGQLAIAGKWKDGKERIHAAKLFPGIGDNVFLELGLDDLSVFRFAANEMWSEVVPGDSVPHKFVEVSKDGERELDVAELEPVDGGTFSIRVITSLAKKCGMKWGIWLEVSIMMFPGTEEQMADWATSYDEPNFPGIKLADSDVVILPTAGKGKGSLKGKAWGCPIAPALVPGAPVAEVPINLAAKDVAAAVGSLLNLGCLAESCTHSASMYKRWDLFRTQPADAVRRPAEKSWPGRATPATASKGNVSRYFIWNIWNTI